MKEHTRTNRVLLASLGFALLGGGLLVLAGGTDIYRRWNLSPPDGWPLQNRHDVLIPGATQTRWAAQDWWWPTAIATLAVLMLMALSWLLAQSRRRRPSPLPVAGSPRPAVTVDDDVLSDVLGDDLDGLTGIRRARARFTGPRAHPEARIDLTLGPGALPTRVLDGVPAATERARRSAGWDELPTHVGLSVTRHGPHRAD